MAKIYCRIPIKLILKFGDNFPFDVYLKLSDNKVVKIGHEKEEVKDTIIRYNTTKGVQDIYIEQDHYIKFAESLKKQFSNKLFNPATTMEEKAEILEKSYSMIKDSLIELGFTPEIIQIAQKISEASMKVVKDSPNIFMLLKKFSNDCPKEFQKALVITQICSSIVDTFDWGSDTIKEKCSLAAMLCDINLSTHEISLIKTASKSLPLTPEQKKLLPPHPTKTVEMLRAESWVARETLSMIELHHEEQDGSGFPMGLTHSRIPQLSAIFIVSMQFTELMFEYNFDFQKRAEIVKIIKDRYNLGVFKKAVKGLMLMLGVKEEAA